MTSARQDKYYQIHFDHRGRPYHWDIGSLICVRILRVSCMVFAMPLHLQFLKCSCLAERLKNCLHFSISAKPILTTGGGLTIEP